MYIQWEDLGFIISYMDATENNESWLIIFKREEGQIEGFHSEFVNDLQNFLVLQY